MQGVAHEIYCDVRRYLSCTGPIGRTAGGVGCGERGVVVVQWERRGGLDSIARSGAAPEVSRPGVRIEMARTGIPRGRNKQCSGSGARWGTAGGRGLAYRATGRSSARAPRGAVWTGPARSSMGRAARFPAAGADARRGRPAQTQMQTQACAQRPTMASTSCIAQKQCGDYKAHKTDGLWQTRMPHLGRSEGQTAVEGRTPGPRHWRCCRSAHVGLHKSTQVSRAPTRAAIAANWRGFSCSTTRNANGGTECEAAESPSEV